MSHFIAVVLVPEDEITRAEDYIAEVMEPYDENLKVAEHSTKCGCIGLRQEAAISKLADKEFGTWAEMKSAFRASHDGQHDQNRWEDECWKPRTAWEKERINALTLIPDPECPDCKGTGEFLTTFNSDATWDWYRVGGRWDGWITRTKVESQDNGFNFGEKHEDLAKNSISVEEYLESIAKNDEDRIPYAVITSDGMWHSHGKMGPFAFSYDNNDNWDKEFVEYLENDRNCMAIALDCHI